MYRIRARSRVESDGVINLRLNTPLPAGEVDVDVSVEPAAEGGGDHATDWNAWVDEVFGSISDPSFERQPQGDFEKRASLD